MFPSSYGNISFSQMEEKGGDYIFLKVYLRGVLYWFQYSCILLRFGNTFRFMPLGDPPTLP
jgi:hypothetical protein